MDYFVLNILYYCIQDDKKSNKDKKTRKQFNQLIHE